MNIPSGNYSDDSEGCSYGQLVIGSFITTKCPLMHHISCSFLAKHQITQVTQPLLRLRFCTLQLRAFPQIKITCKREALSAHWCDSGKYDGVADGDWKNCVRSQGACFGGTEASLSYVQCSLYLEASSINVSFSYYMVGYLLESPRVPIIPVICRAEYTS